MKKIISLGILFIGMCVGLTGCTIQLDDNDLETIEKIKKNTNVVVNGKNVDLENTLDNALDDKGSIDANLVEFDDDTYIEDERFDFSYIDLGSEYYIVVYGKDENGNTTWSYETEKAVYVENRLTDFLGSNQDNIILNNNGFLTALNIETGKVSWTITDVAISGPQYKICESGDIYIIYGENFSNFMHIDGKGNVKKRIDLLDYDYDMSVLSNSCWMADFGEDKVEIRNDMVDGCIDTQIIVIDLKSYKVSVNIIKGEEFNINKIIGKSLIRQTEFGDNFYFNSNGTYQEVVDNGYAVRYSPLIYEGNWEYEDNILKLKATKQIIPIGGHYEYSKDANRDVLVDYTEREENAENEIQFDEIVYYPDYNGKECVKLCGSLYEIVE